MSVVSAGGTRTTRAAAAAAAAANGGQHVPMATDDQNRQAGPAHKDGVDNPVRENTLPTPAVDPLVMAQFFAAMQAAGAQMAAQPGQPSGEGMQARMSPAGSPHHSPAGASRSAREPRLGDLASYDGASGVKLDEWLSNLRRLANYYDLDDDRTVKYGVVHLTSAADLWWNALDRSVRGAITSEPLLAAALRSRFQPVTAERTARAELYRLEQGQRGIDAFIADFQRLCALVPSASEADKLFQFERGLRRDLAERLRVQGVSTLDEAIAMAARVGNLIDMSASSSGGRSFGSGSTHPARLHQMENVPLLAQDDRLNRIEATLNAIAHQHNFGNEGPAGGFKGLGAKTQTQRGYQQQGSAEAVRGGRSQPRPRFPPPVIPGVSPDTVQQRWDAKLCLRCGESGHNSHACPNAIRSSN